MQIYLTQKISQPQALHTEDDFLVFKTAFIDTFEGCNLSKLQLAIQLIQHLSGEAYKRFKHHGQFPTEDTYDTLMGLLEKFYGNTKQFQKNKIKKFQTIPVIKHWSPDTISVLISILEEHWIFFQTQDETILTSPDHYIWDNFLEKLPKPEMIRFKDYTRLTNQISNFTSFKTWLNHQWDLFEGNPDKKLHAPGN